MQNTLTDITHDVFIPANDNEPQTKPPVFDPALFEDDLTDCDMSKEHRLEVLRILWDIMVACADMGWGEEPTQKVCAKLIETAFEDTQDSIDTIESKDSSEQISRRFAQSSQKKGSV